MKKHTENDATNVETPYNFRELQGVSVVSDEVKVHRMWYEGEMQCIQKPDFNLLKNISRLLWKVTDHSQVIYIRRAY